MDHVDLYLIHWPSPVRGEAIRRSWRALVQLHEGVGSLDRRLELLARAPRPRHRRDRRDAVVNQIELHPFLPAARAARGARPSSASSPRPGARSGRAASCSPTRRSRRSPGRIGATPAQVVLRWHLQLGNVVDPEVGDPVAHRREPRRSTRFELTNGSHGADRVARPRRGRAHRPGSRYRDVLSRSGLLVRSAC